MNVLNKFFGTKKMKFKCRQRGCEFEAEKEPEFCPVCNNPANFEEIEKENEPKKDNESN